ncbi:MAG: YceI family protein [Pseudomonadota bacterium]|nr:YceI family protein [Pseudomonadota bacterium]
MFKACGVICLGTLLAACGAPPVRQPPVTSPSATPPEPAAGAAAYRIDAARSELRILVYRAGPMAQFGHNHVIVNRAVEGWVEAVESAAAASFSLRVPVAEFLVDDPQARADEGPDFSEPVPEEARSGTRHNLLSAALLDAAHYPTITLTSSAVTPAPGTAAPRELVAKATVELAGHKSTLLVPFTLQTSPGEVAASGTVVLRQSEMGLIPFSVMLGALQVKDEFTVKFKLVALRTQ